MEPSRRGAAPACRVVVSTPAAAGSARGGRSAFGASFFDHLGDAVAVLAGWREGDEFLPGANRRARVLLDLVEDLAPVEQRRQIAGIERQRPLERLERAVDVLGPSPDRHDE